jgi:pimeloyl-ACP methyl ester carboxylesterase
MFIHGAGGGAWQWAVWREVFEAGGWAVRTPELQPAPGGLAVTTVSDYVQQLTMALDPAVRPGPVLVGVSMGGLLALKLAERVHPAALILINPVPPAGTPGWPPRSVEFPEVIRWSRDVTLEGTRASMPEADEKVVVAAQAHWRDESGAVLRALYAGVEASPPAVPTLVMVGELDWDIDPRLGSALGQRLGADVMRFGGVSHVGALVGPRAALLARLADVWLEGTRKRMRGSRKRPGG